MPNNFDDYRFRDASPRPARRDYDEDGPRVRPRRRGGYYRPDADECSSASLCHLLAIFTGFIGPLIIWLTKKDQSRFVDHHGREALNFSINILVYSLVATLILVVITVVTCGFGAVLFPLLLGISVYGLVLHIMAMSAANRGEWYRYAVLFRPIGPPEGMEGQEAPPRGDPSYDDYEPAPRGSTPVWVWLLGGLGVLLLGGCCVGGMVFAVIETRKARSAAGASARVAPGGAAAARADPIGSADRTRPGALERALADLNSGFAIERARGANSLARMRPDAARRGDVIGALRKQLQDPDQSARNAARQAFVVWAGKDDVPTLLDLLRSAAFPHERRRLIEALGPLKDARASKALADGLKELATRRAAQDALKQLGPAAEDDVRALLDGEDDLARQAACDVLKSVGTKKSLARLRALAADRNPLVARAAGEAAAAVAARGP